MNRPLRLNLRRGLRLIWMPLIGLMPIALTLIVLGVMRPEGWELPLLAMTGMGLAISTLFGLVVAVGVAVEWWNIRRLLARPLATWPQFDSVEAWQAALARREADARATLKFSFGPLITGGVVIAFVSVMLFFVIMRDGTPGVTPGLRNQVLLILWLLYGAAAFVGVGAWLLRRAAHMLRFGRLKQGPLPAIALGERSVYDEVEGFLSLRGLQSVEVKGARAAEGSALIFRVRRWIRMGEFRGMTVIEEHRLPFAPEFEAEARRFAEDVQQRLIR